MDERYNSTGATLNRRNRDWKYTICLGDGSAKEISRGFIQLDEMVTYDKITNLIPSVGSWGVVR